MTYYRNLFKKLLFLLEFIKNMINYKKVRFDSQNESEVI
ncbi:hypothetical protein CBY_3126 [Clostridium butyricum 5521]|uniref:Uncharacterized protein n=1 Tax=Clostridium butyricum E4 str. BoNT E BL5262 TaxID=632245 RepID=C4ICL3_CLOBU|nr:hypothetical protein CBY_3126 [Clostridium butyricum 5521]EEP56326.1 hypothetical protein CLP_0890 [Clostridium butyricum E4 str. BoNT E BL5262]